MGGRTALVFGLAAILLEAVASALYAAATGPSAGTGGDPAAMLASGPKGALIVRVGSVVDMFGYLSTAPVVLYLWQRYRAGWLGDLFAVAGLGFVVIGSIGAVLMAAAAPPLISQFASASETQRAEIAPAFYTLYRGVVLGMWQTLETIPLATWLIGMGFVVRRQRPRWLFLVLLIAGVLNALIALGRLAGS